MVEPAMRCPYEPGDKVVQVRSDWVALMLEDMGVLDAGVDGKLQAAIKDWVKDYVKFCEEGGSDLTMGELNCLAMAYWDGYEKAQTGNKREGHGKR